MGEDNIRFPIIADGQINTDVLVLIDKDSEWLTEELTRHGYEPRDIFLAEYLDGESSSTPIRPIRMINPRHDGFSLNRRAYFFFVDF